MATQTAPATRQIRIASDLADMIGDIVEVSEVSTADFLDPIIRPHVEVLHARVKPAVEAIEAAKRAYGIPELGDSGA